MPNKFKRTHHVVIWDSNTIYTPVQKHFVSYYILRYDISTYPFLHTYMYTADLFILRPIMAIYMYTQTSFQISRTSIVSDFVKVFFSKPLPYIYEYKLS